MTMAVVILVADFADGFACLTVSDRENLSFNHVAQAIYSFIEVKERDFCSEPFMVGAIKDFWVVTLQIVHT